MINGKAIEPERVNYLPLFSMIFQDYTIFNFSVGENIDMGKGVPRDVCRGMLDEIGLGHIGPETYLSQIFSEDGIELSGGENQKLAMARALCKDAPVVILDEPTAALSPQSEYEIYLFLLSVSGLTAALGIAIQMLQRSRSDYDIRATNTLYYDLNGKAARLDMRDCEDEERIDEYYKVFDNIYHFSGVDYEIFCTILSKTVSCALMSCVLVSVDWRLFLMIVGIHIISMLVKARQDEAGYRFETKKSENTKRQKYLRDLMYDFKVGRELRIFHSGKWFREKVRHENQQVHKIDLQIQRTASRYGILLGMLKCIQLVLIYVVSIQKYESGYIVLSSFVMYINATRLITDSISAIADAISFLHDISLYYRDFENLNKVYAEMYHQQADYYI